MSTKYIDRTNTNQKACRRANLEMGEGADDGIIRPLSDILRDKRRKLYRPYHQKT